MAPRGSAYFTDWILAIGSSVHVANDRDWFITFTQFKTCIGYGGLETTRREALGIGDVELDVKTSNRRGNSDHRKIILHDVLYVPTSTCNILGAPVLGNFCLFMVSYGSGLEDRKTGAVAGLTNLIMPHNCYKLWLVRHQEGRSSLDSTVLHCFSASWPDKQRARWERRKDTGRSSLAENRLPPAKPTKLDNNASRSDSAPYSSSEKAWLKRAFGNEFEFLTSYELSIHREEDREEGRRIARAMIEQEAADDSEDDEAYSDTNSLLEEWREDPTSHMADYHFSKEQLSWIKKHYHHSGNFMICYGLKPFDDEDCRDAVELVRSMEMEE